uniref:Uncharacterized protein n=1 Tax=Chromera velia CCMP2878 TaxID=1169474 RepID=A0A0G4IC83_9ALVE|eukprot:Cvel_2262.t1-p1 / transcript=Cvel_2262.t1 / gene=Cvel_2262 / organism=Chromera_velia_CCMP2878 / gene_product=Coiled-coil domain-containing protein 8 homolog, putative / transcript_product=Coiled-coil domain-containing protein 8 homolog, putative / location=Cvel_scaffold87:106502-111856(+) / protein_length=1026 / sequence_SO=supercontig / SO=protein_coding / is_pseudo=false
MFKSAVEGVLSAQSHLFPPKLPDPQSNAIFAKPLFILFFSLLVLPVELYLCFRWIPFQQDVPKSQQGCLLVLGFFTLAKTLQKIPEFFAAPERATKTLEDERAQSRARTFNRLVALTKIAWESVVVFGQLTLWSYLVAGAGFVEFTVTLSVLVIEDELLGEARAAAGARPYIVPHPIVQRKPIVKPITITVRDRQPGTPDGLMWTQMADPSEIVLAGIQPGSRASQDPAVQDPLNQMKLQMAKLVSVNGQPAVVKAAEGESMLAAYERLVPSSLSEATFELLPQESVVMMTGPWDVEVVSDRAVAEGQLISLTGDVRGEQIPVETSSLGKGTMSAAFHVTLGALFLAVFVAYSIVYIPFLSPTRPPLLSLRFFLILLPPIVIGLYGAYNMYKVCHDSFKVVRKKIDEFDPSKPAVGNVPKTNADPELVQKCRRYTGLMEASRILLETSAFVLNWTVWVFLLSAWDEFGYWTLLAQQAALLILPSIQGTSMPLFFIQARPTLDRQRVYAHIWNGPLSRPLPKMEDMTDSFDLSSVEMQWRQAHGTEMPDEVKAQLKQQVLQQMQPMWQQMVMQEEMTMKQEEAQLGLPQRQGPICLSCTFVTLIASALFLFLFFLIPMDALDHSDRSTERGEPSDELTVLVVGLLNKTLPPSLLTPDGLSHFRVLLYLIASEWLVIFAIVFSLYGFWPVFSDAQKRSSEDCKKAANASPAGKKKLGSVLCYNRTQLLTFCLVELCEKLIPWMLFALLLEFRSLGEVVLFSVGALVKPVIAGVGLSMLNFRYLGAKRYETTQKHAQSILLARMGPVAQAQAEGGAPGDEDGGALAFLLEGAPDEDGGISTEYQVGKQARAQLTSQLNQMEAQTAMLQQMGGGAMAQPVSMAVASGAEMPLAQSAGIAVAQPAGFAVAQPVGMAMAQPMGMAVASPAEMPLAQSAGIAVAEPAGFAVAQPVGMAMAQPVGMAVASPAEMPLAQSAGIAVAQPAGFAVAQPVGMAMAQPMGMAVAQPVGGAVEMTALGGGDERAPLLGNR